MSEGSPSEYIPGQLTQYPVGSVRELWTLAYPLMLSMFSVGAALFADSLRGVEDGAPRIDFHRRCNYQQQWGDKKEN